MIKDSELTIERLKECVTYDPLTGLFFSCKKNSRACGPLNAVAADGTLRHNIDGRRYQLRRLAWFWVHGDWPTGIIRSKNQSKTDNRIDNLVDSTWFEVNRSDADSVLRKNNTSGVTGVRREKYGYVALLNCRRIGTYPTMESAVDARKSAFEFERMESLPPA